MYGPAYNLSGLCHPAPPMIAYASSSFDRHDQESPHVRGLPDCGNRMAARWEHFRDARGSKAGFRRALCSTQSCPTCTHDDHIECMIDKFICSPWVHILTPIALPAYAELLQRVDRLPSSRTGGRCQVWRKWSWSQ